MREITVKFWCNAGYTEEEVTIQIEEGDTEENQIQIEFLRWLNNNEQCGWEKINKIKN